MKYLMILFLAGCSTPTEDMVFRYRINQIEAEGCMVVNSTDLVKVNLVGKPCGEYSWCHPCQDGRDELCPDISAPGEWVDVYSLESITNPWDYVEVEECR